MKVPHLSWLTRPRRWVIAGAIVLGALGCGAAVVQGVRLITSGSSAGAESPEALAEIVVESVNAGDADAFGRTFPSDEVLSDLLECASGWGPFEAVRAERNRLTNVVASTHIEFESIEIDHGATEAENYFIAEAEREGCTVKSDVATVRFSVRVVQVIEGEREERTDSVLLLRTSEGWFLAGAERRLTE